MWLATDQGYLVFARKHAADEAPEAPGEDPDPDRALDTLDALGMGHLPNRSYGDVLRRRRLPTGTSARAS